MTAITGYMPRAEFSPPPSLRRETRPWPVAARVAFRFLVVYFVWYCFTTQMLGSFLLVPKLPVPDFGKLPPMKQLVMWVGHSILHVNPILAPTGSGDTMYDWTQAFMMVVVSAVIAIAWSLRTSATRHDKLFKWFSLFLRFMLGTTMLSYGFAKVFPLQMPTIFLSRLLEPYGNFSPMGVIWYSIGAAPGYERFIGSAEVLGGVLLFFPRTTLLGALVTFAVTTGIFMVNMTYDVPVKLFAFHLVVMSIVLFAADVPRLLDMFVFNRTVEERQAPRYGSTRRANRAWLVAQVAFTVWALGLHTYVGTQSWHSYGGAAPKSVFYGIWDVDSMTVDGILRPPLTTDTTRYSHAVFQTTTGVTFQKMSQSFDRLSGKVDTVNRTIALKNPADAAWHGTLKYERPAPNRLALDGDMGGKRVQLVMTRHELEKFLLVSRGFHWVQEFPVNR
jgi:hypothetical protein